MFISDFAIKRPIITVVSMIALVVFGLASLARLGTDEFPEIAPPVVFVAVAYPGAAPDVVEREVVTRIEDKLSAISGVDKINPSSTDGFGQVVKKTQHFGWAFEMAFCVREKLLSRGL